MTDKLELLEAIYRGASDVDLEDYEEGGYRPIHIGDELYHYRSRVVHKLGNGPPFNGLARAGPAA